MPNGEGSKTSRGSSESEKFEDAGAIFSDSAVRRISVKIPPYWSDKPDIWFAQVEAQFAIAGILTDITQFNTVVAAAESSVLAQITDAVLCLRKAGMQI